MKHNEFASWLDGAINLSGKKSFDEKQTNLLREGLYALEDKSSFTDWLKGIFEGLEPVSIDERTVIKINAKLQELIKPQTNISGTNSRSNHLNNIATNTPVLKAKML